MSFSKQFVEGDSIKEFEKKKSMKVESSATIKTTPLQSIHAQQRKSSPSIVINDFPNHSKAVYRSDAVKDPSTSFLKPMKSSMKKNSGVGLHSTLNISRATCSSTFKSTRHQESLDLEEQDDAPKQKLCTYKYCSLHGQKHEAQLPALKCFLSPRRQSAKVQNGMNKKLTRKYNSNKIEVVEGALQLQTCREKKEYEAEIVDVVHGINEMNLGDHDEVYQLQESHSVTSFEDYLDEDSEISKEDMEAFNKLIHYVEGEKQAESALETGFEISPEADEEDEVDYEIEQSTVSSHINEEQAEEFVSLSLQSGAKNIKIAEDIHKTEKAYFKASCEEEEGMIINVANAECCKPSKRETACESQLNMKKDADGDSSYGSKNKEKVTNSTSFMPENPLAEMTNKPPKEKCNSTRKITTENQENGREFHPRPPRFLLSKPEPQSEVVKLKHQDVEERKNGKEWMIDYALQNTLRRMAPARKRKVSLLVAAFESVIQQEKLSTSTN